MRRMDGTAGCRRSMRRLILYAMFFCIVLFLIVGLAGLFFLSNSYYAEFARNQEELLESYYHYLDKCMEDGSHRGANRFFHLEVFYRELQKTKGRLSTAIQKEPGGGPLRSMTEIRNFGLVICIDKTERKAYAFSIKRFSCAM